MEFLVTALCKLIKYNLTKSDNKILSEGSEMFLTFDMILTGIIKFNVELKIIK